MIEQRLTLIVLVAKVIEWCRGTQHMWMAHSLRPSFPSYNKNLSSLFSLLACMTFKKHKYNWVRVIIIFFDEKNENPERWIKREKLIIDQVNTIRGMTYWNLQCVLSRRSCSVGKLAEDTHDKWDSGLNSIPPQCISNWKRLMEPYLEIGSLQM